ncbi:hypothetical protein PENSTE_c016G03630 [Penicillium steckii]|uniref:DDHD domain-containing protein n=1 Tax=Penicillium steckii TaxID=303698 RepID=A0A1V6SYG2_9EURO|nr:hypothetical protein PENSTE_c016G03630 [Penicillium steckii]
MAGNDQKSFLGTFSPWNTPRSSTPQPADHAQGSDVLQRSQGEDHTVTHRHKLGQRHYPPDCPPLKVRWYYAVDSPKRKPSLNDQKKPDQKPLPPPKKFIPFSLKDSQSIEATFQNLVELEDTRSNNQARKEGEKRSSTKVAVNEDYLFDVDVEQRELSPAYWIGPVYEVRRGTWLIQDGSNMKPCEENLATQLEEGYLKLRPWKADTTEVSSVALATSSAKHDRPSDRTDGSTDSQADISGSRPPESTKSSRPRGTGSIPSSSSTESRQYRLFGAYMNRIVAYENASTAWVTTDDFMSRVSTTVYQKLGGAPGIKVVRSSVESKRPRETSDLRDRERKPAEKIAGALSPDTPTPTNFSQAVDSQSRDTEGIERSKDVDSTERRPQSTLERQMSSLAGEPQNPDDLEEQARRQEEQEMEDLREVDGEDRDREVDHLILVTHGIGQRLGLRLESINFIHDVNVLRKTLKTVYKASPDLRALNSAFADKDGNCRVQVLPVCWRHLLDFPYRGVRQNRKELDLTDADTVDDDAYPSLADITLESVPAVRNLISDLAMDVLLYQSGYCEHISNIVKQECNRILGLYKQRNPSFKGTVSLCGHSLGSAILFDILCHQPNTSDAPKSSKFTAHGSNDIADQRKDETSELNFECEEFFCLGSPIALFQMLKGKTIAGYSPLGTRKRQSALDIDFNAKALKSLNSSKGESQSHAGRGPVDNSAIISAPKCRDLYNIFHPSDPVSYRLEPLISPAMASLKPQPLPSVKKSIWTQSGQSLSIIGSRMGQSVGSLWSNFTSGVASSLLNRSLGLNSDEVSSAVNAGGNDRSGHKRSQSGSAQNSSSGSDQPQPLIEPDLETLYDGFQKSRDGHKKNSEGNDDLDSEEQERKLKFEDAKVRGLNSNGRVDYSIQEGAFDISLIASIASHLTYWGDEDVNHFMLSQVLSRSLRHRNKV